MAMLDWPRRSQIGESFVWEDVRKNIDRISDVAGVFNQCRLENIGIRPKITNYALRVTVVCIIYIYLVG